jgi:hypothetical protein
LRALRELSTATAVTFLSTAESQGASRVKAPRHLVLVSVGAIALTSVACAQAPLSAPPPDTTRTESFEPEVGQQGKDVIWVPTPQELVDRMLDIAKVTPADYLIDLGSGDGRTVITAAKRGLTALGIEYEPQMVELSRRRAIEAGVQDRARFEKADLFETDLSRAQVITLFLLPSINEKLRPRLLDLAPGTRVVSNSFTMGDWEPDDRAVLPSPCTSWCTALLWIIPAKVQGEWQLGRDTLALTQTFQKVTGTLGGQPVTDGQLLGKEISFKAGNRTYAGTVEGGQMRGRIVPAAGPGAEWSARRR